MVLAAVSLSPVIQTWAAQAALAHGRGTRGSLRVLSARFGRLQAGDLRLENKGAVLTIPSLEADLPLARALWSRELRISSLVASDWTLDLTRVARPRDAISETLPALAAAREVVAILGHWTLPCAMTLDGVALEGDVLAAPPSGRIPIRLHVVITGGGMEAGRRGNFSVVATVMNRGSSEPGYETRGRLAIDMDSARTFNRLVFSTEVTGGGDPGLAMSAIALRGGDGETWTFQLARASRTLMGASARFGSGAARPEGTWSVDLRDGDAGALPFGASLPFESLAGAGRFDAPADLSHFHLVGSLRAAGVREGALPGIPDVVAAATLVAGFDLTADRKTVRVDRASATVAGDGGWKADVALLQPVSVDEATGAATAARPDADTVSCTLGKFPLARLHGLPGGLGFASGETGGAFALRLGGGGFSVRGTSPLVARGVSVAREGVVLGRGFELTAGISVNSDAGGWRMKFSPLAMLKDGRRLAGVDGTASGVADPAQAVTLAGKWTADLSGLAGALGRDLPAGFAGRMASGNATITLGPSTEIDGDVAIAGGDPGETLSANGSVAIDPDGSATFSLPLKRVREGGGLDLEIEGTRRVGESGPRVDVRLSGERAALGDLGDLAAAAAAFGGAGRGGVRTPVGIRDRVPFWGDWVGRVTVALDHLTGDGMDLRYVDGIVDLEHGQLRLEHGRAGRPGENLSTAEGFVAFDDRSRLPYTLTATVNLGDLDAAAFFGTPAKGHDPVVEGRFAVSRTISGQGINREDLESFVAEDVTLTSSRAGGILRVLKTSLGGAIREAETPVADTLGNVGSAVGSFFGVKPKDGDAPGGIKVAKNTQAVLDFLDEIGEIGYDRISIHAIRAPDQSYRLATIEMIAPDAHLVGFGKIGHADGLPAAGGPLSADFQLGVRGKLVPLARVGGLLSDDRDSMGYSLLSQPSHVGGTAERVDLSAWQAVLAAAAKPTAKSAR